ncbi:hypothetical protein DAPK24_040260 [Pichia kluyveri]|uniref:Uncharacterized protein n=1 Tax=Pichia kluyveri TaxID=36015 RepID=A0AAV5R861_PICKL|nr:hypothetical protein DAPK24_040260 [Pichia kluyveri]
MTWTTTGTNRNIITSTETYVAQPEPATQFWTGSYTTTTLLTTSAINSDYIPVFTTMTIVEVPYSQSTLSTSAKLTTTPSVSDEYSGAAASTNVNQTFLGLAMLLLAL